MNNFYGRTPFKAWAPINRRTRINGWTLIELMATLAVFAVLISTGLPGFHRSIEHHTEKIAFKTLQHLSYYARTEAIKRMTYYTLCPSNDQRHCNGQWNDTLIVFSDHNKNEIIDGPDVLYRTLRFAAGTPCIIWNLKTRQYLQFKPSGASNGTAGHFRLCDADNSRLKKKVVVSFNGRVSLKNL